MAILCGYQSTPPVREPPENDNPQFGGSPAATNPRRTVRAPASLTATEHVSCAVSIQVFFGERYLLYLLRCMSRNMLMLDVWDVNS